MSAQTSVSAEVSDVGPAGASAEVLGGASEEDGVTEATVVEAVESVEMAPLDWLPDAATVVVNVTATSAEDPAPPDEQPATQSAPAISSAVTRRMVVARPLRNNINKTPDRIVNCLSFQVGTPFHTELTDRVGSNW